MRPLLSENLISVWEFDETSGTTANDSHGSNDGVIGVNTDFVTGKVNGAFELRGAGANVIVDNPTMSFTNAMTINTWVNFNYESSQQHVIDLITEDETGGDSARLAIYTPSQDNTGFFAFMTIGNNSTTSGNVNSNLSVSTNTWHMVTCVLDPLQTYPQIYVNGVDATDTTGRVAFTGSGTYTVYQITMGEVYQQTISDCILDQVAVWDRALTSTEISALYNSGNGLAYSDWA